MIGSKWCKEWDWRGLEWIEEIDERGVEQGKMCGVVVVVFSTSLCSIFPQEFERNLIRNHRSYTVGEFRTENTDRILLEIFELKSPIVYTVCV